MPQFGSANDDGFARVSTRHGWVLWKPRSSISPLRDILIKQNDRSNTLNHVRKCQVSPELSCGNAWQIWMWYYSCKQWNMTFLWGNAIDVYLYFIFLDMIEIQYLWYMSAYYPFVFLRFLNKFSVTGVKTRYQIIYIVWDGDHYPCVGLVFQVIRGSLM